MAYFDDISDADACPKEFDPENEHETCICLLAALQQDLGLPHCKVNEIALEYFQANCYYDSCKKFFVVVGIFESPMENNCVNIQI